MQYQNNNCCVYSNINKMAADWKQLISKQLVLQDDSVKSNFFYTLTVLFVYRLVGTNSTLLLNKHFSVYKCF